MRKKYKVEYNFGHYETEIDTLGLKFQDFKAIHPKTKVTITRPLETHIVQVRYIKLAK